ncbi:agamous-like MADS-box protein AGL65 [Tasmannia lanceolata]|uniref:agamous-like MADS-box protein AGL65 n=1 Tax=Tasmannia lanceolata TaxID=3420 RepID=UPI0040633889
MGKAKIKMEKLGSASERQNRYAKRKVGITKKVKDISILCDIDIALVMFSPAGKPTLCLGEHSDLGTVLKRFSEIDPFDRAKRKRDNVKILKDMLKKLGYEIDLGSLSDGSQILEDFKNKYGQMEARLSDAHERLSCWVAPEKLVSPIQITDMEESLLKSLNHLRASKVQPFSQLPEGGIIGGNLSADPNFAMNQEYNPSADFNFSMPQGDVMSFLNPDILNEDSGLEMPFPSLYPSNQHLDHNSMGFNSSMMVTGSNPIGSNFVSAQNELVGKSGAEILYPYLPGNYF